MNHEVNLLPLLVVTGVLLAFIVGKICKRVMDHRRVQEVIVQCGLKVQYNHPLNDTNRHYIQVVNKTTNENNLVHTKTSTVIIGSPGNIKSVQPHVLVQACRYLTYDTNVVNRFNHKVRIKTTITVVCVNEKKRVMSSDCSLDFDSPLYVITKHVAGM